MVKVNVLKEFRVASNAGLGIVLYSPGEQDVPDYVALHSSAKDILEILDKKFIKDNVPKYEIEPPNTFESGPKVVELETVALTPEPFSASQDFSAPQAV